MARRPPLPFDHILRCLGVLRLTDAQKADIKAVLEAAKPEAVAIALKLKSDEAALKAEIEKTPPEPCAIGRPSCSSTRTVETAKALFDR